MVAPNIHLLFQAQSLLPSRGSLNVARPRSIPPESTVESGNCFFDAVPPPNNSTKSFVLSFQDRGTAEFYSPLSISFTA